MDFIKVICVSEPDISYTSNKALKIDGVYYAEYDIARLDLVYDRRYTEKLNTFGETEVYTIYDADKVKLGQYFAIDFVTVADLRERRIKAIFED
jgi:hypothetical protein